MTIAPGPVAQPVGMNDAEFHRLARLAHREFGLSLSETKKPLVQSRLAKRLKAHGLTGFNAYLDIVEQGRDAAERSELISALTTNVTSFFREAHHFETLRSQCLPPALGRARSGGRIRIWSAGCSSGQEAYSLAMVLQDLAAGSTALDMRILATDIDPQIVARAKAGQYPAEDWSTVPDAYRARFADQTGGPGGKVGVSEALRRIVSFAELNLMEDWPFAGPFDAIFCRNVAIYFDQPTQQRLWARFVSLLRADGYLFIGHSERVTGPALQNLAAAGVTTYRRVDPATTDPSARSNTWA